MFLRTSLYMLREENQLDATEWFIALVICSTYFGHLYAHHQELETILVFLMCIGPCIIVIVEEWNTNFMPLAILFHFLCAQHVSDINMSIIRSLRLCCWITTSVVLFSVRCVLEQLCFSLQNEHHPKPAAPKLQHTTKWEQDDRCGKSTTQSQAPEDAYINIRNKLIT